MSFLYGVIMALSRMRTINEALQEIKQIDSGTSLKANGIRILYSKGLKRFAMIGRKYLIDLDSLIKYLCGE